MCNPAASNPTDMVGLCHFPLALVLLCTRPVPKARARLGTDPKPRFRACPHTWPAHETHVLRTCPRVRLLCFCHPALPARRRIHVVVGANGVTLLFRVWLSIRVGCHAQAQPGGVDPAGPLAREQEAAA